jgi:hypothetical protein
VFIQYLELHAYYDDQTPDPPSATDSVRLTVIAERHADLLDTALLTTKRLALYCRVIGEWDYYITHAVASSSHLRSMVKSNTDDWSSLKPFVSRYDDSQTAPLEGAR